MSAVLLDTHALVWWARDPELLSDNATQRILGASTVAVSAVSLWEIAIRESGKRPIVGTGDAEGWFRQSVAQSGFDVLGIELEHLGAVQRLPRHHGDPFDRLLVAQAIHENLTVVSRDRKLAAYEVDVVW